MSKPFLLAAAALVALPVAAQTPTAPVAKPAVTAKLGLDTPVAELMADPAAKAVVTANLPDLAAHPMYEQFKGMSLNQLAPMAPDKLGPDVLKKIGAELAALK